MRAYVSKPCRPRWRTNNRPVSYLGFVLAGVLLRRANLLRFDAVNEWDR